jgi:hypothetical protein
MPPLALPPTTAYPSDPTALERERLDALYLELRGNYKSLMISRGIHRSRSEKQGGQLLELSQRLRALATREASVKAEAYAMLEIVTDVVEHLEDAGDEMGTAFGAYQLGRRSYNGGGSIGRLVQAVISFLNRWRTGKERFEQLSARQEALRASLEGNELPSNVLESNGQQSGGPKNGKPKTGKPESHAYQLTILPQPSQDPSNGQDR